MSSVSSKLIAPALLQINQLDYIKASCLARQSFVKQQMLEKERLQPVRELLNFSGLTELIEDILVEILIDKKGWPKFKSLSKRERQLLKLIAEGNSNKELGEQLFISEHTVRTHRKNIFRKIGARSILELINFSLAFKMLGEL